MVDKMGENDIISNKDFELLGLTDSASVGEIKKKFKELADKLKSKKTDGAKKELEALTSIKNKLTDSQLRKEFKAQKKKIEQLEKKEKKEQEKAAKKKKAKVKDTSKLVHEFVPLHEKISQKEVEELFEYHNITMKELPKIRVNDPAIRHLDAKENDVIKITRKSKTSGESVFYRGVINE